MGVVERQLALAAVALLAGAIALTATAHTHAARHTSRLAAPLPAAVGSYSALVGAAGPETVGHRTACGATLGVGTLGVAHPTLPCGTLLYLTFGKRRVLTEVVDRGPYGPGRQFDVTTALARLLGLGGVQTVTWSYARVG